MSRNRGVERSKAAVVAGLAALLWLTPPLAGQSDLDRLRAALGEAQTERIAAVIDAAERDGLPRGLLVEKAVEGVAKSGDADVVLAGVADFADELRAASNVVGTGDADRLEKAADAMRRGVDRALLTSLNRDRSDDFAIMVVALLDLLDVGVEQQLAEDLIRYAATQGLEEDEVLALPADVKRLVRQGSSPGQAVSSVQGRLGGRNPV